MPTLNIGVESAYVNERPARLIGARHSQLQVTADHKTRRHVGQLERAHGGELARDPLEHRVVLVPRCVYFLDVERAAVAAAAFARIVQVASVRLQEGALLARRRTAVHHHVQHVERLEHAAHVLLAKVELGRLLETLVPHLVPENGHTDQLLAHQLRLIHERAVVLA